MQPKQLASMEQLHVDVCVDISCPIIHFKAVAITTYAMPGHTLQRNASLMVTDTRASPMQPAVT